MKTCTECGWVGEQAGADEDYRPSCPSCDKVDCIQDGLELHLRLDGEWERFVTVNKPIRFARAVRQAYCDGVTGLQTAKDLARAISNIFEVQVKVVGNGPDVVIDEF